MSAAVLPRRPPHQALRRADRRQQRELRARRDQIVGLIGPNGAGKTTLLRLITKILRPDAGRIVFNGEDITGLRPWDVVERGIAGTFQNTRPFRHLPIVANVMVPLVGAARARAAANG